MSEFFSNGNLRTVLMVITLIGVVAMAGAWYYSTKDLPPRVNCLERSQALQDERITQAGKEREALEAKINDMSSNLQKIKSNTDTLIVELKYLRGAISESKGE